jgi:catechol 2,3-dioxygenase-like lactoylglutathione lyase family enzyme
MSWYIHHVNLQAHDVLKTAAFFRDIVGMEEGTWTYPENTGKVGHSPDTLAYFGTENRGLHIVRAITSFAADNDFIHNPTIGGHHAICVPDVLAVKVRLEAAGVVVSDAGVYAMAGMHQIYCYDPSSNIVEINQVVDPIAGTGAAAGGKIHPIRREPGGWYIHHVNRQAHDVPKTAAFYSDLIGMPQGSNDSLAVFGPENRGMHLVRGMVTFHVDNNLMHNPTFGGHVAITVPSVEAVMKRMNKAGHLYSDAGTYAMAGMHQLYTYDPSMNFIEINEDVG